MEAMAEAAGGEAQAERAETHGPDPEAHGPYSHLSSSLVYKYSSSLSSRAVRDVLKDFQAQIAALGITRAQSRARVQIGPCQPSSGLPPTTARGCMPLKQGIDGVSLFSK